MWPKHGSPSRFGLVRKRRIDSAHAGTRKWQSMSLHNPKLAHQICTCVGSQSLNASRSNISSGAVPWLSFHPYSLSRLHLPLTPHQHLITNITKTSINTQHTSSSNQNTTIWSPLFMVLKVSKMRLMTVILPACLTLTTVIAAPAPNNVDSPTGIPCPGLACYDYLKSTLSIFLPPRDPQITQPWDLS